MTYLAEDDALSDGQEVVERNEDLVFVLLVLAVHVELPDVVDRELVALQLDLVRVRRKLVRKVAHVVGERRREEDNLHLVFREHAAGAGAAARREQNSGK